MYQKLHRESKRLSDPVLSIVKIRHHKERPELTSSALPVKRTFQ